MQEKIIRNLQIVLDLIRGEREEQIALRYGIDHAVLHRAAENTIRKLVNDDLIKYLSVKASVEQFPELERLAQEQKQRLEQEQLRGLKLPHRVKCYFTIQPIRQKEPHG